eukprot:8631376-Heterocapsa_arctica.AAC.1
MLSVIASVPRTTCTGTEQPPTAPHTCLDPNNGVQQQPSPPQPNEGAAHVLAQNELPSDSPAAA